MLGLPTGSPQGVAPFHPGFATGLDEWEIKHAFKRLGSEIQVEHEDCALEFSRVTGGFPQLERAIGQHPLRLTNRPAERSFHALRAGFHGRSREDEAAHEPAKTSLPG